MSYFSKYLLLILLTLIFNKSISQNDDLFYQKIEDMGISYVSQLKAGNIEGLKNANPPEGTWIYSKLLDYKKHLEEDKSSITYGSFVEPSNVAKNTYAFNFFALKKQEEVHYFFVAVISFTLKNGELTIDNTYLFTEENSLKNWWKHTFGFYHSDLIEKIPKKYLYENCPPPPFKE